MKKYRFHWLFLFLILSIIFGAIFKVGTISLDATVYDPLAYKAVDQAWATALLAEKNGETTANLPFKRDVATNLETVISVYTKDKKIVASSAQVDGKQLEVPTEFFDGAAPEVRNYVDWEPKEGVHVAGVIVSMGEHGYVFVGRSMQEDDRHYDRLAKTAGIGWAASVVLMTAGCVVVGRKK